jgi:hypothetical protein
MGDNPVKETQIGKELKRLTIAISNLDGSLSTLEERLSIILGPSVPLKDTEEKPSLVPLAGEIYSFCEKIEELADRVNSMLNRLEI